MRRGYVALAGAMTLLIAAACTDKTSITDAARGISPGPASRSVSGAGFTSTNPSEDDPNPSPSDHDLCQNAKDTSPANNCNTYFNKNYVWLTGGPGPSALADGTYMFAVLVPGGQGGNENPNDCTDKNLSDFTPCPTSNTDAGDTWDHRVFSIVAGVITYPALGYPGGHSFANNMIRLMPYDNTTNSGGEYVMAICKVPDVISQQNPPGVTPSDCKYDNFKVRPSAACPDPEADDCGVHPFDVSVVTDVHLSPGHSTSVTNASPAPLGSTVHDKVTVDATVPLSALPSGSKVTFYFWKNNTCDGTPFANSADLDISGTLPQSVDDGLPEGPLGAGEYSYKATFTSGNLDVASDGTGECEPFKVDKADPTTSTDVHNSAHDVITGTPIAAGTTIHDKASVGPQVGSIAITGKVTFKFFNNTACTGDAVTSEDITIGSGEIASGDKTITVPGAYGYKATYNGDANYAASTESGCEPVYVPFDVTVVTDVHLSPGHTTSVTNASPAPLGSSVHDKVTVGPAGGGTLPSGSKVKFYFWTNNACTGDAADNSGDLAISGALAQSVDNGLAKGPLGAGEYSYKAEFKSGDLNVANNKTGDCEPFKVSQASTTTTTDVHDASHNVITGKTIVAGTVIHDKASVGTQVGSFAITGTVTFKFYGNAACTGDAVTTENITIPASGEIRSADKTIIVAGAYGYRATYNGNTNYAASTESGCEPITFNPPGKTMGFWGNNNGQALILGSGGYAGNAVDIGRGGNIDSQGEALKVLPNTLNACGKGTPYIFITPLAGAPTGSKDCGVNSGVNVNSLNTLAAQTLALGYNIIFKWGGYPNITVAGQGCSSFLTTYLTSAPVSLTAGSSMAGVFTAAKGLIDRSYAGNATQAQIGAMNSLLGCLNKEA